MNHDVEGFKKYAKSLSDEELRNELHNYHPDNGVKDTEWQWNILADEKNDRSYQRHLRRQGGRT